MELDRLTWQQQFYKMNRKCQLDGLFASYHVINVNYFPKCWPLRERPSFKSKRTQLQRILHQAIILVISLQVSAAFCSKVVSTVVNQYLPDQITHQAIFQQNTLLQNGVDQNSCNTYQFISCFMFMILSRSIHINIK